MIAAGASLGARANRGGKALARPFTAANLDLTAGPAPSVALTTFTQTTGNQQFAVGSTQSSQPFYLGTRLSGQKLRYATTNPGGTIGTACRIAGYPNGFTVADCDSDLPVYNYSTNTNAPAAILRNRVVTDINAQEGAGGGDSGAIDAGGLIKDNDVSGTAIDGIWPGYNTGASTPGPSTVVEGNRALGAPFNYYGGYDYAGTIPWTSSVTLGANTGLQLTATQIQSATPLTVGTPMVLTGGELVTTPLGTLGSGIYRCVVAGTTGSENPSGNWPGGVGTSSQCNNSKWCLLTGSNPGTGPAQPFTSGTAQLVFIGGAFHSDAGQTTDRQRVTHRRGMAGDFANSCFLLQNASGNSNPLPPMNWTWEDYIFRGGGNFDLYCQTQTGDHLSAWTYTGPGGCNGEGGFIRNSDGTWSINPDLANSRPWHASYRRNTHLAPTSPNSPRLGAIPSWNNAITAYGAVMVSSEAIRDAGIAAQYGWSTTDPRLAAMRAGAYDYTTMPPPVSSVLETRLQVLNAAFGSSQTGALTVCCGNTDARCWVVWEPSNVGTSTIDVPGTPLTPHASANSLNVRASVSTTYNGTTYQVTDAQGYYIGG